MVSRIDPVRQPPDHIAPLIWARDNLASLSRFLAAKMDGSERDIMLLSSTFAILRAKQQIVAGITEQERLRREVAR